MMTPVEIEQMNARISANADKLIAKREKSLFNFSTSKAGRKPASFANSIQPEIQEVRYLDEESWPLWVDDPVVGVSRLDWDGDRDGQRPLSTKNIMQCFACLEEINASTISYLLNIGKRHAQRYMKACELIHDRLVDNYCDDEIRSMRYPAVFIYPKENVPQTDLKEE